MIDHCQAFYLQPAPSLLVVVILAEGLPVLLIPEQFLISSMGDDVVNHGSGCELSFLPALHA